MSNAKLLLWDSRDHQWNRNRHWHWQVRRLRRQGIIEHPESHKSFETIRCKNHSNSSASTSGTTYGGSENGRLRLPKLDLPNCDGFYSQWSSFVDLSDGTVDSMASLTDSQKLFYLKGVLSQERHGKSRALQLWTIPKTQRGRQEEVCPRCETLFQLSALLDALLDAEPVVSYTTHNCTMKLSPKF